MILAIEREWGKVPGWFVTLDAERRARLLADWQIRHKPPKTKSEKHKRRERQGWQRKLR